MPKVKHTELVAWRQHHFAELESTLKVLKEIRDDPEASHKDRIEASKSIGRLLSAMSPSKAGAGKPPGKDKANKQDFTDEELDEIRSRLAA